MEKVLFVWELRRYRGLNKGNHITNSEALLCAVVRKDRTHTGKAEHIY